MELKDVVSNKELSQRLKELGVKQESLCYWSLDEEATRQKDGNKQFHLAVFPVCEHYDCYPKQTEHYSAYTVAELGELLKEYECESGVRIDYSFCNYYTPDGEQISFDLNTEANARAKCLVYLLENDIISVNDINKGEI